MNTREIISTRRPRAGTARGSRLALLIGASFTCLVLSGCGPTVMRVTPTSPAAGIVVHVREFKSASSYALTRAPDNTMAGPLRDALTTVLLGAGVKAGPKVDSPKDLIVEGEIVQSDLGSRRLRYVAGPAGAAQFAVKGRTMHSDGTVVGNFSVKRKADRGLFGGDSKALLQDCVEGVAADIANMIISGDYKESTDSAFYPVVPVTK